MQDQNGRKTHESRFKLALKNEWLNPRPLKSAFNRLYNRKENAFLEADQIFLPLGTAKK